MLQLQSLHVVRGRLAWRSRGRTAVFCRRRVPPFWLSLFVFGFVFVCGFVCVIFFSTPAVPCATRKEERGHGLGADVANAIVLEEQMF
jgi:hypothetical protein